MLSVELGMDRSDKRRTRGEKGCMWRGGGGGRTSDGLDSPKRVTLDARDLNESIDLTSRQDQLPDERDSDREGELTGSHVKPRECSIPTSAACRIIFGLPIDRRKIREECMSDGG